MTEIYYIDDEPIYNHKLIENDDFEPNKECSQCDVEYTCWDCEAEQIRNRYPDVRYTDSLEWVVPIVEKVYTFPDNTGTFKVIEGELHFLDCFSKEYEAFCIDYKDVLNDDQIKTLKEKLGDFTMYRTHGSWGNPFSFVGL